MIFNIFKQKVRMDYNAVLYAIASGKELTQSIAFSVGEMFRF